MKDLDFDELDRAVNSLMTNTSADSPQEPTEKVVTIASTLGDTDDSHTLDPSVATPAASTSQPTTSSLDSSTGRLVSPAARRGGRFMDVVHPSSDMTSATPHHVSREGVSIATPTAPTATLPEPVADPVVSEEAAGTAATESEPTVPSWPDPIDFHKDTSTPVVDSVPVETPTIQTDTSSLTEPDVQDPLQSPFLAGAKVDKRPLGAFAGSDTTAGDPFAAPATPPEQPTATDDEVQTTPQPVVTPGPTPLPDELKSDIVAIESDNGTVDATKTEVTATVQSSAQPAATTVSLGTTSIKQQYQEEPSTTPVEHAPIYDSEPYHQPLTHPAKKKSGWLVVLLIFLLLILGAGAGAAIYFYVL